MEDSSVVEAWILTGEWRGAERTTMILVSELNGISSSLVYSS